MTGKGQRQGAQRGHSARPPLSLGTVLSPRAASPDMSPTDDAKTLFGQGAPRQPPG